MYFSNRVSCNGSEVSASVHAVIYMLLWLAPHMTNVFYCSRVEAASQRRFLYVVAGTKIHCYFPRSNNLHNIIICKRKRFIYSIQACIKDVVRRGAIKYMENLRPARCHAQLEGNQRQVHIIQKIVIFITTKMKIIVSFMVDQVHIICTDIHKY